MMNQKERNEVRANTLDTIEQVVQVQGFEVEGRTKEGILMGNGEGQFMTLTAVVHKEGFDAEDKLNEFVEAQAKAAERAKAKAEKKAKRKTEENEKEEDAE